MKRRLLFSYLSITAFVLLVLEIPLGVTYANSVERRLASDIQHDAFAAADRSQRRLRTPVSEQTTRDADLQRVVDQYRINAGGRVIIVNGDGIAIADSNVGENDPLRDFSTRPEIRRVLDGRQVSGTRYSRTLGYEILYVALPVGSSSGIDGAVRVTYPASLVHDRIRDIWVLLLATGGVVLGIVFLVSLLLARSMTRPLAELRDAAVDLGRGDLSVRAEVPRGPAELAVLAESFNTTAARLEQLVGSQRAFVADASHQLRTPLAALRLRLENLEADAVGPAADDLDGALTEVRRLSRLVDGLLALARAEQASSSVTAVPLDELVEGRCDAWDAFAVERHVRIEPIVAGSPVARVTPGRLEQVVDNLLNNALEVAPPGTAVRLSAAGRAGWVELRVSDDGPGMSVEERVARSTASGSPAPRDARADPTATSASASQSCASSSRATAVRSSWCRRRAGASR